MVGWIGSGEVCGTKNGEVASKNEAIKGRVVREGGGWGVRQHTRLVKQITTLSKIETKMSTAAVQKPVAVPDVVASTVRSCDTRGVGSGGSAEGAGVDGGCREWMGVWGVR